MSLNNMSDLFKHELQDLYSAETQIIEALPKMAKMASAKELQNAFAQHLQESEEQRDRLERICRQLNIDPSGEKCKAMEGLVKEGEKMMKEKAAPEVMDAALIAIAQKVEHYEIASYGTAVTFAELLGEEECATMLRKTLKEEKMTDEKLTKLAESKVNAKAVA